MIIATPVTVDGQTAERCGKSHWIGVAEVSGPRITSWKIHEVGWDEAGLLGRDPRHARIARFLTDQGVTAIVASDMGPRLAALLAELEIEVLPATPGDARESVLAAVAGRPTASPA